MHATVKSATVFRQGTSSDALCIGVLATQVFLDTYATEGIRMDIAREVLAGYSPDAFAHRLRSPSTSFVVAECSDHMVGFAEIETGTRCPLPSINGDVELVTLYLQRRFQRCGIGRQMLLQAERAAKQSGAGILWLTVWAGNANARAFYAACDYEDEGITRHVIEDRAYDNRVLVKRLA